MPPSMQAPFQIRRCTRLHAAWARVQARHPHHAMPPQPGPTRTPWLERLPLALLAGAMAWLSLALVRSPGELSPAWLGNGIVTGWLLSRPGSVWPGHLATVFAAELAVRLSLGDAAGYSALLAACNAAEVLMVSAAVRRAVPDVRDPAQWMRLGGVAATATLLACAATGVLAAMVSHALQGQPFRTAFTAWYAGHVVSMVVLATTTGVVQREGRGLFVAPGRGWDLAATLALVATVASAVFASGHPVLFLAYPALLLAALRHGMAGAALGLIVVALAAAATTAFGHGPFWRSGMAEGTRLALVQLYLAGGCLMTIPMCLSLADRKRMARRLAESERRFRLLADHSHDVISRVTADGHPIYLSPAATDMFGIAPHEMPESRLDLVHPEDRDAQRHAMARVLETGESRTEVYRIRHRDGHYVWIESVIRRVPPESGEGPPELMFTARNISSRVATQQALEESRRELERLSREDALTGLANRRQFDERLAIALKRLSRHGTPVALLYMDLDRFKQVNDSLGHAAGDAVLKAFGSRLCDGVRETDLVARIGGDEFAILLDGAPPGSGETVAAKLLQSMREPLDAGGTPLVIGTSIGIAYATAPVEADALVQAADAALYAAKHAGRGCFRVAGDAPGAASAAL